MKSLVEVCNALKHCWCCYCLCYNVTCNNEDIIINVSCNFALTSKYFYFFNYHPFPFTIDLCLIVCFVHRLLYWIFTFVCVRFITFVITTARYKEHSIVTTNSQLFPNELCHFTSGIQTVQYR